MELNIVGAGLIVMMVSLSGVLFTHKIAARFLHERLSYLVAFSAGVFMLTAGAMTLEVFELAETTFMAIGLIVVGYVLAWGTETLLPESHEHHSPDCEHGHQKGAKKSARKIISGDAIHNIGDGIMLAAAFGVSPALGLAATVSIVIHEALQEISEFFVLKQAGYSTIKALTVNFIVSGTVFIGIGLGYFALASHDLETLLLAVSSGFFWHVVTHDLVPKRKYHETTKEFIWHIAMLIIGLLLMAGVVAIIHDEHVHGEGDHHGHDEAAHHEEEHHDEEEIHGTSVEPHAELEEHEHHE